MYATYESLGKDKSTLPSESMIEVYEVKSAEDRKNILRNNQIVVIDNYAPWCGPCKQVLPQIKKLAKDFHGDVVIVKENVDDKFEDKPRIMGVPVFHFYLNGNFIDELTITGAGIPAVKENIYKLLEYVKNENPQRNMSGVRNTRKM